MTLPADSYRVLVVDDEEAIVELVGEYLRARGHEVYTARDGDEALDVARTVPLDVVLTDLRLPVRGGMSLLEALAELATPVATVVMTGFGTVETATQAMKYGATDYLLKPVRLREVYDALERAVRSARAARAQDRDRRRVAFYEAALGIEGEVSPDTLAILLVEAAVAECGGPCAVRVSLEEGSAWRRVAGADDAGHDPAEAVLELSAAGPVGAGALRLLLWSEEPGIELITDRLAAWVRMVADAAVHAGVEDLPTTA